MGIKIFIVVVTVFILSNSAEGRDNAFVIKLGGLVMVKPDTDGMFVFGTQGEYAFAGPVALAYGVNGGVNEDYMRWSLDLGIMLKLRGKTKLEPTIRTGFMVCGINPMKKGIESMYILGSSFGVGVRYRFETGKALGLELGGEAGRVIGESSDTKKGYFAFVPTVGFEF